MSTPRIRPSLVCAPAAGACALAFYRATSAQGSGGASLVLSLPRLETLTDGRVMTISTTREGDAVLARGDSLTTEAWSAGDLAARLRRAQHDRGGGPPSRQRPCPIARDAAGLHVPVVNRSEAPQTLRRRNFSPSKAISSGVGSMSRQMQTAELNAPRSGPKLSIVSHAS